MRPERRAAVPQSPGRRAAAGRLVCLDVVEEATRGFVAAATGRVACGRDGPGCERLTEIPIGPATSGSPARFPHQIGRGHDSESQHTPPMERPLVCNLYACVVSTDRNSLA